MHVHILGICGTFMAGIAVLARQLGHRVSGSDANVYPPMSDQLREQGITLTEGYEPDALQPLPECVIVGNALSRGNPAVEFVLDEGLDYTSGPEWLARHVLRGRHVIAVAGTHGKTTTTSMIAWILEAAGLEPGFLVGGVPGNFPASARLGAAPYFVVEADEYDTAFFDKRSKFVHYGPRTLVINNVEYDHADIFPDLEAIKRQFHHLVRVVPGTGLILHPDGDPDVADILSRGCWSTTETFGGAGADWRAEKLVPDASRFKVLHDSRCEAEVQWDLIGAHNAANGLAAVAAARHAGVGAQRACHALAQFRNVKRRLEVRAQVNGIVVYDDFAHHPTAVAATLRGLRARVGEQRILAVLEPRSNTMRLGVHRDTLGPALGEADLVWVLEPAADGWDAAPLVSSLAGRGKLRDTVESIVEDVVAAAREGDHVLIMSNGGFHGFHDKLIDRLKEQYG